MLQIKIIHIYLSMSRTIDCVFYNPVKILLVGIENFRGVLQKFVLFSPPTP